MLVRFAAPGRPVQYYEVHDHFLHSFTLHTVAEFESWGSSEGMISFCKSKMILQQVIGRSW